MKIWRKCVLESKSKCLSWGKLDLLENKKDKIALSKPEGKSGKGWHDRDKLEPDHRGSTVDQVKKIVFHYKCNGKAARISVERQCGLI